MVSTDASGNISTGTNGYGIGQYWSISFECAAATNRSSRCAVNVPAGSGWSGDNGEVYFKLQAQTAGSQTWCDLSLELNGVRSTVWRRADVNTYLSSNSLSSGSWCGNQTPTSGWVATDFSFALTQYSLPTNRVSFGTPRSSTCPSTVGAEAILVDSGFLAMASNAGTASYMNDFDRDNVNDKTDTCIANKSVSQADSDGNGVGDACDAVCYVPASDPMASWYDYDGDGVDDLCDTNWSGFNPSQY